MINPDDFVITRKRKKYRFALFANSPLCFEFSEWLDSAISKSAVYSLEIGAGTGLFSVELAARYPDKIFVALDVKADRLQKGARRAEADGLDNIFFVRTRADQVGELFRSNSLSQIWLTFPDPFARNRSAKRRLTHPIFLESYAKLLANDGRLLLKHDDLDFFCWSLEQFVKQGWHVDELSFDLHQSDLNDDYKITTTYEERWIGEAKVINFARASRHKTN